MEPLDEGEIRRELRRRIALREIDIGGPDDRVPGSGGTASWYDYHGITFGKTVAEQEIIDRWLVDIVGQKLGYEIEALRQADDNGHCMLWFKRKVSQK